jgi:hypothetical protein
MCLRVEPKHEAEVSFVLESVENLVLLERPNGVLRDLVTDPVKPGLIHCPMVLKRFA